MLKIHLSCACLNLKGTIWRQSNLIIDHFGIGAFFYDVKAWMFTVNDPKFIVFLSREILRKLYSLLLQFYFLTDFLYKNQFSFPTASCRLNSIKLALTFLTYVIQIFGLPAFMPQQTSFNKVKCAGLLMPALKMFLETHTWRNIIFKLDTWFYEAHKAFPSHIL